MFDTIHEFGVFSDMIHEFGVFSDSITIFGWFSNAVLSINSSKMDTPTVGIPERILEPTRLYSTIISEMPTTGCPVVKLTPVRLWA